MALPLPSVVANVGPGGPLVTALRGTNALRSDILNNQIKQSEADYAPYTNYSNALSKVAYANYLPFQIRAQVLSNPMVWMAFRDNPQAMQQMMNQFAQSIPQGNDMGNGNSIPFPSARSNGLLGALLSKLGSSNGNSSNNLMQPPSFINNENKANALADMQNQGAQNPSMGLLSPPSSTQSPLIPATQGGLAGVFGKQTAPFNSQAYKPGTSFVDPNTGDILSAPTDSTITTTQTSINAANRVLPQLQRLADLAAPFMSLSGNVQNQAERAYNFLLNPSPEKAGKLPTQYAAFQSLLNSAPESLLKSYGLRPTDKTIDMMENTIKPLMGETKDQYKTRILQQLENIKNEQVSIPSEQLVSGFNLTKGNKPTKTTSTKKNAPPTDKDIAHTAKINNVSIEYVKQQLGLQ